MIDSYKRFWTKGFNFEGRSTRSNSRFAVLANLLVSILILIVSVIAGSISEPLGGAHRNWEKSFSLMKAALVKEMKPYLNKKVYTATKIKDERLNKFRLMGDLAIGHTQSEVRQKK